MTPVFYPVRWRCAAVRGTAPPDPADSKAQDELAAQHAAFDLDQAKHAELLRETDALQTLMLQELKNEDEIMKKWIALI